jgi:hypothetical protein
MDLVLVEQAFDGDIAMLDQLLEPFLRAPNVSLVGALLVNDEDFGPHV